LTAKINDNGNTIDKGIAATMPRKPNYRFERFEREKSKAAKKAARLEAKRERAAEKKAALGEMDTDVTKDDAPPVD
jgi:hypothetical protein